MMGMGEKKPEKQKVTKSRKKFPVWLPSPPPVYEKWRPAVFRCGKTLKTSRTYPRWDWGLSLVGQRNTGLGAEWDNKKNAGNMLFYIHVNFQDLQ